MSAITITGEVTRSAISERVAFHSWNGRTEFFADVCLRLPDGSSVYFHTPAVGRESEVPVFEFGTPMTVKGRVKAERISAGGNRYKVLNYVKVLDGVRKGEMTAEQPSRGQLVASYSEDVTAV